MTLSHNWRAATAMIMGTALLLLPVSGVLAATTAQCDAQGRCVGTDKPSFNRFTDNPQIGNERLFYDGKSAASTTGGGFQDSIQVKDGQELLIRVFVHNSAHPSTDTNSTKNIAKDVRVKVNLPASKVSSYTSTATISGSNAASVSDTLKFSGDRPFTLKYVVGSAEYQRASAGRTADLGNPSTAKGVSLGDVRAGMQHQGFVVFKVKVSMPKVATKPVTPTVTTKAPAKETNKPASSKPKAETVTTNRTSDKTNKPAAPVETATITQPTSKPAPQANQPKPASSPAPATTKQPAAQAAPAAAAPVVIVAQQQSQSQTQAGQGSGATPATKPAPAATQPQAQTQTQPLATQPAQTAAATLPETGGEGALAGILGSGSIGYGLLSLRRSRRSLRQAVLTRAKRG